MIISTIFYKLEFIYQLKKLILFIINIMKDYIELMFLLMVITLNPILIIFNLRCIRLILKCIDTLTQNINHNMETFYKNYLCCIMDA